MMRHILLGFAFCFPLAAVAQDQPIAESDEIIVEGQRLQGGDAAMSAFLKGDFVTAEIEFEKNFIALRRDRESLVRFGQDVSNATLQGDASLLTDTSGDAPNSTDVSAGPRPNITARQAGGPRLATSGRDLGTQLYMAGLSELQQGKVVEAERSFKRAVGFNDRLYDARMRWALLKLNSTGDLEFAQRQLKLLQRSSDRCKNCDQREELEMAVSTLDQVLASYLRQ
jgi:TolA-binding protein